MMSYFYEGTADLTLENTTLEIIHNSINASTTSESGAYHAYNYIITTHKPSICHMFLPVVFSADIGSSCE